MKHNCNKDKNVLLILSPTSLTSHGDHSCSGVINFQRGGTGGRCNFTDNDDNGN